MNDESQQVQEVTQEIKPLDRQTAIETVIGIALHYGGVVKGVAETCKALESQKAKVVFLAEDCDNDQYKNTVQALAKTFGVPVVSIDTWVELKDSCKLGLASATIVKIAEDKGKEPKMKPRCSCATIIDWGEDSEARQFLEKEFQ